MRLKPLSRNTVIGLAMAAVSVLLLTWSLLGKPDPFSSSHVVWARFRNVSSLIRFDRYVRIGGADVGTIGDVERRGDIALVQLKLDDNVAPAIRADATAALRPHTLFDGNSFIELNPGSPSAPPLGNHVIPLSRTTNYVTVDKALRVFSTPTRPALQRLLRNAAASLGEPEVGALRQTFNALPALMPNVAVSARALQGPHGTELAGSIRGLAQTVSAIAAGASDVGPSLQGTAATAGAVDTQRAGLNAALAELPGTLAASDAGSAALDTTLGDLEPLARDLQPALRQLAPTLVQLRPTLRVLGPALRQAGPFAALLGRTLSAGRAASGPTIRILNGLLPAIRTTKSTLIPFLLSPAPSGVSMIESLAATGAGAAGALSPVKTLAQGAVGDEGAGHIFYTAAAASFEVACSQIPVPVLARLLGEAQVCTP